MFIRTRREMKMRSKKEEANVREQIMLMITNYFILHGYAPSLREIGDAVGLVSASSVSHHLDILKKEGRIESDATLGSSRAFRVKGMKVIFDESGEQ